MAGFKDPCIKEASNNKPSPALIDSSKFLVKVNFNLPFNANQSTMPKQDASFIFPPEMVPLKPMSFKSESRWACVKHDIVNQQEVHKSNGIVKRGKSVNSEMIRKKTKS
jgi:hypothetical protein